MDNLLASKIKKEEDLFAFINNRIDKISNYNLLLGAGASVTSGVSSAQQLVEQWRKDIFTSFPENKDIEYTKETAQKFFREKFGREYDENREYSFLFKEKYHLPAQRRNFVETTIKDSSPNIGYRYLANLIRANYFNTIFTTNFDDLLEQCLISVNLDLKPITCSHDASISSIPVVSNRPKIIKLHGDFLFDDIKTTIAETNRLEENMQNKFEEFLKNFGLIVIGYSGCDDSIMDILERLIKKEGFLDGGLYWCTRNINEIENNYRLKKLLLNDKAYIVKIDGFDEFFAKLNHSITEPNFDKDPFKKEKSNIFPLDCIEKIIKCFPNNELIKADCENYKKTYKTTLTQALDEFSSKYSSKEKNIDEDNINLSKLTDDPSLKGHIATLNQYLRDEKSPEELVKLIEKIEKESYNFSDIRLFNYIERLKLNILKKKNDTTEIIRTLNELKQFNEEKKFIFKETYIELAECYIDKQKWDEAIKVLTEAINKNQYEYMFYLLLASAQYGKYRCESNPDKSTYDDIKNTYIHCINLNPSVRYNQAYGKLTDFLCLSKTIKLDEEEFKKIIIEPFQQQNIYDSDYPYILAQKAIYDYNNGHLNPFEQIDQLYSDIKAPQSLEYKSSVYRNYLKTCLETKRLDCFENCKTEIPFTFKKNPWFIKITSQYELSIHNNLNQAINILQNNLYLDNDNELLLQLLKYKIYNEDYDYVEQNLNKLSDEEDIYDIKTTLYEYKKDLEKLYTVSNEHYLNSSQEFYDKMKYSYHLLICKKYQECYDLLNVTQIQNPVLEINYELARKGIGKSIRNDKINALYTQCSDEEKAAACVLLNKNEEAISILNNIIQKDKETYYRIKVFPVFETIVSKLTF